MKGFIRFNLQLECDYASWVHAYRCVQCTDVIDVVTEYLEIDSYREWFAERHYTGSYHWDLVRSVGKEINSVSTEGGIARVASSHMTGSLILWAQDETTTEALDVFSEMFGAGIFFRCNCSQFFDGCAT